jgi:hypothetical protein
MYKRISLANALAVFVAASGMALFIARPQPINVQKIGALISSSGVDWRKSSNSGLALAAPTTVAMNEKKLHWDQRTVETLVAGPKEGKVLAIRAENTLQHNVPVEDTSKDAIDLGEIVIRGHDDAVKNLP